VHLCTKFHKEQTYLAVKGLRAAQSVVKQALDTEDMDDAANQTMSAKVTKQGVADDSESKPAEAPISATQHTTH